jgi:hypothetical protein
MPACLPACHGDSKGAKELLCAALKRKELLLTRNVVFFRKILTSFFFENYKEKCERQFYFISNFQCEGHM